MARLKSQRAILFVFRFERLTAGGSLESEARTLSCRSAFRVSKLPFVSVPFHAGPFYFTPLFSLQFSEATGEEDLISIVKRVVLICWSY
jgi:hypothetical protein